jgi:succinate dehydrogenase/fumarate reductase flavoprotein subunit
MLLGPVMIAITVTWFSWMFWDGMRPERAPRRPTHRWKPGEPGPWWTNDGFDVPEPIRIPAERGKRHSWADARGRALDTKGNIIPGLYAAGNAGGAPTKGFYGGAGGTISLGLVFGQLAGREAATESKHATHRTAA